MLNILDLGTNFAIMNNFWLILIEIKINFSYVELSSNERTEFKARELKSVHVDAEGTFLKLVVHKNFVNKLNTYNQVGLIALNVIGTDLNEDVNFNLNISFKIS